MKIFINRQPRFNQPWGGGNLFISAFVQYMSEFGHEVVFQLEPNLDCIFIQDPRPDELGIGINEIKNYKIHYPSTFVVHRVNECDKRKDTNFMDILLQECSKISNKTVFVSNWMKNYHLERGWHCKDIDVIINGVNKDIFYAGEKLNNGKVNIITFHWSDNPLKGQQVYQWLNDFVEYNKEFTFTFIGRTKAKLQHSNYIQPLFGENLGNELRKYDICINGSVWDPAPNSVIESISSGIPTYVSADGGGAVELAGADHTFSNFAIDLIYLLQSKNYKLNSSSFYSWKTCIEKYKNFTISKG